MGRGEATSTECTMLAGFRVCILPHKEEATTSIAKHPRRQHRVVNNSRADLWSSSRLTCNTLPHSNQAQGTNARAFRESACIRNFRRDKVQARDSMLKHRERPSNWCRLKNTSDAKIYGLWSGVLQATIQRTWKKVAVTVTCQKGLARSFFEAPDGQHRNYSKL